MNKRVDDLFFQYEYKMNNIQKEYKGYIISINKEINEFIYKRLFDEKENIFILQKRAVLLTSGTKLEDRRF